MIRGIDDCNRILEIIRLDSYNLTGSIDVDCENDVVDNFEDC